MLAIEPHLFSGAFLFVLTFLLLIIKFNSTYKTNLKSTPKGNLMGGGMHKETLTPILTLFLKLCNKTFFFIFSFFFQGISFYILVHIISTNILVLIKVRLRVIQHIYIKVKYLHLLQFIFILVYGI